MIMKRTKSEVLIFCEDPFFYKKYAGDIFRLAKRVKAYLSSAIKRCNRDSG